MNIINHLFTDDLIRALGWTLIHSLWQGGAVALFSGIIMLILRKQAASLRYLIYSASLLIIPILALITFFQLYHPDSTAFAVTSNLNTIHQNIAITNTSLSIIPASIPATGTFDYWLEKSRRLFESNTPILVIFWLTGMLFFLLRYLGAIIYTQRLKHYKTYEVLFTWEEMLSNLKQRVGVQKTIRLMESALVKVPVVIGSLKPIILLPIGILGSVPTTQLEAILLHELAHIQRRDYLVNLLQSLIEVIFFFNPAVWWISKNIRIEREHVCDDIALNHCSDSLTYIKALTHMQELQSNSPALAPAMTGKRRYLLNRIRRMTEKKVFRSGLHDGVITSFILFMGILALTASAAISFEVRDGNILLPEFNSPGESVVKTISQAVQNSAASDNLALASSKASIVVTNLTTISQVPGRIEGRNTCIIIPNKDTIVIKDKRSVANSDSVKKVMQEAQRQAEEVYKKAMDEYQKAWQEIQTAQKQKQLAQMEYEKAMMEQFQAQKKEMHDQYLKQLQQLKLDKGLFENDSIDTICGVFRKWSGVLSPELFDLPDELGEYYSFKFPEMPELPEMPCPEPFLFSEPFRECPPEDLPGLFHFYNMPDSCRIIIHPDPFNNEEMEKANKELERSFRQIDRLRNEGEYRIQHERPTIIFSETERSTEQIIRQELLRDDLIRRSGNYIIEINKEGMYINGEKQPREVARKYKHLYESLEEETLNDNNSFKLIL